MQSVHPVIKSEMMYICEIRPRKDKRNVDLISDVLPFGRLCYGEPNSVCNAVSYAMHL